jgi:cyclase
MPPSEFRKTLHAVGGGAYAYVQHDGSWGWSNSGLVVDGRSALVVDTLLDLHLTREMLDAYMRVLPAAASIESVVNSHANGDHTFGNQLLGDARIVASRQAAEEMAETLPGTLERRRRPAPARSLAADFQQRLFGAFDFEGIELRLPDQTFEGRLSLRVGAKQVDLIEVGPAHTRSDVLVVVPADRVVYTADILFIGAHPIMWEGPVENWVRALDLILGLDVDTIVPGHGPLTDRRGVEDLKRYFLHLDREARRRHEAGLSVMEAALDISFPDQATWAESERIVANVQTLYRWYSGAGRTPVPQMFALMAEFEQRRAAAP